MTKLEHRKGVILAISAYIMWGFAPIYFKAVEAVPAHEILLHRIIWSFAFILLISCFFGNWQRISAVLVRPKQIALLCLTSLLIGGNWLLFIWAVNNDHLLDASLGYFINPLVNVFFGMVFLGEKLSKLEWLAVLSAAMGVVIQLISFGSIPLVSIALGGSFSLYALLRKKVDLDAKTGLLLETSILLPLALAYLIFASEAVTANMFSNELRLNLLLIAAGVVTSLPLLSFAAATIRIPLSTLGFLQYIGPSIMFLLAVSFYQESFDLEKATTFGFIWLALIIVSLDMIRKNRKRIKSVTMK